MLNRQVIHETLDGETVIINLGSGAYFSVEGSGADLWSSLIGGESPTETAAALAERHSGDRQAVTAAVIAFHQELFDHDLITARPPAVPAVDTGDLDTGDLGTFEPPHLRVYNDLREHLLIDPVHDVERGTGWPAVAAEP